MINKLLAKVFGTENDRYLKRLGPRVEAINELEPETRALSDEQLKGKTLEFRRRLEEGATRDELLVESFAVVREAGRRVLGMRHFDVQLMGGMILHEGSIAEMRTGEGKTLVATLPTYLNALDGSVHVVTVNDYLARRDAEWMGRVYRFLGLSVGVIQHDMSEEQRREAYSADVTYATNNELGFDYLRDNMKFSGTDVVQCRGHQFAIVDEVDSILVDEARTPLIISGPSEGNVGIYAVVDRIIPKLDEGLRIAGEVAKEEREEAEASGDYIVDIKARNATFTEQGVRKAEQLLNVGNLYDPNNIEVLHALGQALRAHTLYVRDKDYVVEEGEVVIIDEHTGRKMPGRRWSDGLHQAVEAKEGVKIQSENQTLATITFQNFFRMYEKLSGMTGTAETEAAEFAKIYELDVRVVPTNMPMVRDDRPDLIYRTEKAKLSAVCDEIVDLHESRQPVLVGTVSIEKSELLSNLLRRRGIPHQVLNAKHHHREAEIVAQAGRLGGVTIATNMAGRGTDILLGGNPEILARSMALELGAESWEAASDEQKAKARDKAREVTKREHDEVIRLGGLYVLGTERHEARRIDNQLRGRAGRQGDPGVSRFYLSLEDELMRRFASNLMDRALSGADDAPIESTMVSRAIERAQRQVEGQNFEIRKRLLEYDDVQNKQRQEVYGLRREILGGEGTREFFLTQVEEYIEALTSEHLSHDEKRAANPEEFRAAFLDLFGFDPANLVDMESDGVEEIGTKLRDEIYRRYEEKEGRVGAPEMRLFERHIILRVLDSQWKDHLLSLDHLKEGISLRAYAQRDPLIEYKREAFELFSEMKARIEEEIIRFLVRLEPLTTEEREQRERQARVQQEQIFRAARAAKSGESSARKPERRSTEKVRRNEPCPCGSGKKYKKCCGAA